MAGELATSTSIMHPRGAYLQLSSPALDRPLAGMAVTHNQSTTVFVLITVTVDVFVYFSLQGLG